MRFAKILCTLGPASSSEETIAALLEVGANGFRVNFSHGTHEANGALIQTVRKVSKSMRIDVPILQDLQGPKIRTGKFTNGSTELVVGAEFVITAEDVVGDDQQVSTTYKQLPEDVKAGDFLFLDDGMLRLEVKETDGARITCIVRDGGLLKNNKGINLVGSSINQPALTEKDREDMAFGVQMDVDYVALSFVRSHTDVMEAREALDAFESKARLISKIERPEALKDITGILRYSDGIMVARGDLGVELPPQEVPPVQKSLIKRAKAMGKMAITATQMLESMIHNRRPTRAEASDVANAVYDGSDAVMLSGETAAGEYPVEAVQTMSDIITKAEETPLWFSLTNEYSRNQQYHTVPNAVCGAANGIVDMLPIKAIAVFTMSGKTAVIISNYRPWQNIYAYTPYARVRRQLNLLWGIRTFTSPIFSSIITMTEYLEEHLQETRICDEGDLILLLGGSPVGTGSKTNFLKIHQVGDMYNDSQPSMMGINLDSDS